MRKTFIFAINEALKIKKYYANFIYICYKEKNTKL